MEFLMLRWTISHFVTFYWQVSIEFSVPFLSIPVKRSLDSMKSWASSSTAFVTVCMNHCVFKKHSEFDRISRTVKKMLGISFVFFFLLKIASNDECKRWSYRLDWSCSFGRSCFNFDLEICDEGSSVFCE